MTPHPAAFRPLLLGSLTAPLLGTVGAPCRADFIIMARDSTVNADGTGSFDVTIHNSGTANVEVGGFQVELSLLGSSGGASSHVKFSDATRATSAPYLFAAAPGPGPLNGDASNPFPNTSFVGSDNDFAAPGFQTIDAGATLGQMHVDYVSDRTTSEGAVTISVLPYDASTGGGTLLSDVNGAAIASSLVNGTITTTPAVPEPSSALLVGIGAGLMFLRRRYIGKISSRDAVELRPGGDAHAFRVAGHLKDPGCGTNRHRPHGGRPEPMKEFVVERPGQSDGSA